MNILLIEDDQFLAESLIRLLDGMNHTVAWVDSLHGALTAVEMEGTIDLVLSDWDLGLRESLNGGEICLALKKHLPDARFVIASGVERQVPEGVEFYLKDSDIIDKLFPEDDDA